MQLRGEVHGVRVYDDFAHHPTAIATTIDGLRRRVGKARIIAVLEPRSNTMRMGVHQRDSRHPRSPGPTRSGCTRRPIWAGTSARLPRRWVTRGHVSGEVDALARELAAAARPGDHVLVMSNGGFGGLHGKLLSGAGRRRTRPHGRPSTLPLFPLHTVLFPGGPLPLRIFEPRYLDMVRRCFREQSEFGVVLIIEGEETGAAAHDRRHRHDRPPGGL